MKHLFYLLLLGSLWACQNKEKKTVDIKKTEKPVQEKAQNQPFQLYQMSEMAAFMEKMYADHKRIKTQIVAGKKVDSLNFELTKILYATMTDSTDYDTFYKENAKLFVQYEQQLLTDSLHQKKTYNKAVNLCISCHQTKCTGPIPRIKKLLIR